MHVVDDPFYAFFLFVLSSIFRPYCLLYLACFLSLLSSRKKMSLASSLAVAFVVVFVSVTAQSPSCDLTGSTSKSNGLLFLILSLNPSLLAYF